MRTFNLLCGLILSNLLAFGLTAGAEAPPCPEKLEADGLVLGTAHAQDHVELEELNRFSQDKNLSTSAQLYIAKRAWFLYNAIYARNVQFRAMHPEYYACTLAALNHDQKQLFESKTLDDAIAEMKTWIESIERKRQEALAKPKRTTP